MQFVTQNCCLWSSITHLNIYTYYSLYYTFEYLKIKYSQNLFEQHYKLRCHVLVGDKEPISKTMPKEKFITIQQKLMSLCDVLLVI